MIPYADFERAVTRWKIRQSGGQVASSAEEGASGAVVAEMAAPNAEVSTDTQIGDDARTPRPEDVSAQFGLPSDSE